MSGDGWPRHSPPKRTWGTKYGPRETVEAWPHPEPPGWSPRQFLSDTERPGALLLIEGADAVLVTAEFPGTIPQIGYTYASAYGPEWVLRRMERRDWRNWIPVDARIVLDGCEPPPEEQT